MAMHTSSNRAGPSPSELWLSRYELPDCDAQGGHLSLRRRPPRERVGQGSPELPCRPRSRESPRDVSMKRSLTHFRVCCREYFICLHVFSPGGLLNDSTAFWLSSSVRLASLPPSADALSFPSVQNGRPFSKRVRRDSAGSCRSLHAPLVRAALAARDAPSPCALHIQ